MSIIPASGLLTSEIVSASVTTSPDRVGASVTSLPTSGLYDDDLEPADLYPNGSPWQQGSSHTNTGIQYDHSFDTGVSTILVESGPSTNGIKKTSSSDKNRYNHPHIPKKTIKKLMENNYLNIDQINTIASLVSIAGNSTPDWWKKYSYCENNNDGRGYTVSIAGFCSGTSDLLWVMERLKEIKPNHPLVKSYLGTLRQVDGTDTIGGLEKLSEDLNSNDDKYWHQAVWDGIIHFYWTPAVDFANKYGLTSAFSIGFLYDTALFHGSATLSAIADEHFESHSSSRLDELTWIKKFIAIRRGIIVSENGIPDRCDMWQSILDHNANLNLHLPINGLICYNAPYTIEPFKYPQHQSITRRFIASLQNKLCFI